MKASDLSSELYCTALHCTAPDFHNNERFYAAAAGAKPEVPLTSVRSFCVYTKGNLIAVEKGT
jgi:hypothetical protein